MIRVYQNQVHEQEAHHRRPDGHHFFLIICVIAKIISLEILTYRSVFTIPLGYSVERRIFVVIIVFTLVIP